MLDGQLRGVGVRGCMGGFSLLASFSSVIQGSLVSASWGVVAVIGQSCWIELGLLRNMTLRSMEKDGSRACRSEC